MRTLSLFLLACVAFTACDAGVAPDRVAILDLDCSAAATTARVGSIVDSETTQRPCETALDAFAGGISQGIEASALTELVITPRSIAGTLDAEVGSVTEASATLAQSASARVAFTVPEGSGDQPIGIFSQIDNPGDFGFTAEFTLFRGDRVQGRFRPLEGQDFCVLMLPAGESFELLSMYSVRLDAPLTPGIGRVVFGYDLALTEPPERNFRVTCRGR